MMTVDSSGMNAKLRQLALRSEKSLPVIVKQSARRVAVNLARVTIPFGDAESDSKKSEAKVAADIHRAILSPDKLAERMTEEQRGAFWNVFWNQTPAAVNRFLQAIGINVKYVRANLKSVHKSARNVGGVVPKNYRGQTMADPEKKATLIKQVSKKIGFVKYGWAVCAQLLGGNRGVPGWVKKGKSSPGAGTVREIKGKNGVSYSMTNNVKYVSRLIRSNSLKMALDREAAYLKQQIERELKRLGRTLRKSI
jgi:hypothetical protein